MLIPTCGSRNSPIRMRKRHLMILKIYFFWRNYQNRAPKIILQLRTTNMSGRRFTNKKRKLCNCFLGWRTASWDDTTHRKGRRSGTKSSYDGTNCNLMKFTDRKFPKIGERYRGVFERSWCDCELGCKTNGSNLQLDFPKLSDIGYIFWNKFTLHLCA